MKILIIAPEFFSVPSPEGTSVETCIYQIATRLAVKHDITILSRASDKFRRSSKMKNLTIIRVPAANRLRYLNVGLKKVKGQNYDLIQIDNRPSFVPAVRKLFPSTTISVFLHSLTFVTPPRTSISKAHQELAGADLIVANSRSLRNNLDELYPNCRGKTKYVHLGVDLVQFRPPSRSQKRLARKKQKLGKAFTIVYAGRVIERKGIPVLIKAACIAKKSVPSLRLVVAGKPSSIPYQIMLKRLANVSRVPVRFLGIIPRRKMHLVYWLGDSFVCPSQKHEAFGLVVVEALASGTPCIASNIGGIPEIIEHGKNGLLVNNYQSPTAFASAIVKIARNKPYAARLVKQARKDASERFSWNKTANEIEQLYSRAVD